MNNNDTAFAHGTPDDRGKLLKDQVQKIFVSRKLDGQQRLIKAIAEDLKIPILDCAAALLYLHENKPDKDKPGIADSVSTEPPLNEKQNGVESPFSNHLPQGIRLVRYRLGLGFQHNVTLEGIKKVLAAESGVDVKIIANVRIQDCYTLIDLPDEMPQEIFHHLKTVEINGQKLDIHRVKPRNKKRNNRKYRQARAANSEAVKEIENMPSGNKIE
jgi:DbpA RNA binding domain